MKMQTLPARVALIATLTAASAVAQVNWSFQLGTGAPDPYCGYAWDSGRGRLVAFGGEQGGGQVATMKEYDGSQWLTLNPAVRPSARTRPAMAYDEARGVTVLFGGGTAFGNDTWTWNGTTWTQQSPTNGPTVRFGAAMAYDKARQVVVLFGGFVPSGQDASDTWEWNGSNWTQRAPAGSVPVARGAHRMAYDEARGQTVMVGGYSTPLQNTLADTWLWDGTSWTSAGPGAGPGSICDQQMAYDPTRRRVVLFGGLRILGPGNLTDLGATFEWDGTTWTQRGPLSSPSPRNAGAHCFDTVSNRFVAAGGNTAAGGVFADTWRYAPLNIASVQSFGSPCATSAGPVDLEALSLPYIGQAFELQIVDAAPAALIGLAVFGNSDSDWNGVPLPLSLATLGAPGCSLLVSLDVTATVPLVGGSGSVTWNLPNLPSAVGIVFFTQGVVLDPSSPLPFQIDATSARRLTIGAP